MSRSVADVRATAAEMYPDIMQLAAHGYWPTDDEQIAFDRYDLSGEARLVALHSARRCDATAAAIYAAIARSLIPR